MKNKAKTRKTRKEKVYRSGVCMLYVCVVCVCVCVCVCVVFALLCAVVVLASVIACAARTRFCLIEFDSSSCKQNKGEGSNQKRSTRDRGAVRAATLVRAAN